MGIKWKAGEDIELLDTRTGQIDLAQAPDDLNLDVEDFNRQVITRPFNRVVARRNLTLSPANADHACVARNHLGKPGLAVPLS